MLRAGVLTGCCARPMVWLRAGQEPRCTGCGHRQPWAGRVPAATRAMPPWRWPAELRDRFRARATWLDDPWRSPS